MKDSLFNFRELADMPTRCKRRIRRGQLYRTGNITHIENEIGKRLRNELNIKTYVDFRTAKEAVEFGKPEALMAAGIEWRQLEIITDDILFDKEVRPSVGDWVSLYHRLFENNIERWVEFLKIVLASDSAVLYGCLLGKDRTGIATSFLLTTLDVHDEHIQRDYALSTEEMRSKYYERFVAFWKDSPLDRSEIFHHYLSAHPEIIGGFCEVIRRDDEKLGRLLESAGFTSDLQERLKNKLLAP